MTLQDVCKREENKVRNVSVQKRRGLILSDSESVYEMASNLNELLGVGGLVFQGFKGEPVNRQAQRPKLSTEDISHSFMVTAFS